MRLPKLLLALSAFVVLSSCTTLVTSNINSSQQNSSETSSPEEGIDPYEIYLLAVESGYAGTFQEWLAAIRGEDGNPIEFHQDGTYIYWRYVGTTSWIPLVLLSDITEHGSLVGPSGEQGETPYIGVNGNWWIGLTDTGIDASPQGEKGDNGVVPHVGNNGHWWIGSTDTGVSRQGQKGQSAFERFLEQNPDYTGTEKEWITALVLGKFDKESFIVSFNSLGGSDVEPQVVKSGLTATKPADPIKLGHDFQGWYADDERWVFIGFAVTEDIALTARWTPTVYPITYYLNGGTNHPNNPTGYTYNTSFTFLAPTRSGYDFIGWFADSIFANAITVITSTDIGPLYLYAQWEAAAGISINYVLNGGTNSPLNLSTLAFNSSVLYLTRPTRTGYIFNGWFTDSSLLTSITNINPLITFTDVTVYAKWTIISSSDPFSVGITLTSNYDYITHTDTSSTIKQIGTIKFIPTTSGYYEIYSLNDFSYDIFGTLYGPNGAFIDDDDDSGVGLNFSIYAYLEAGTRYYIRSHFYSASSTGSWRVYAQLRSTEPFTSYTTISLNTSYTVTDSFTTISTFSYFKFVPSESGIYQFASSGSKDTIAIIVSRDNQLLTGDDDAGSGSNFAITFYFLQSQSYYIATQLYTISDTGSYSVSMIKL